MSSKIVIPKNVPKFVAPMKEGEVMQFNLEEKKKEQLKEKDIFEGGEKDYNKIANSKVEKARKNRQARIKKWKLDKQ